MYPYTVHLLYTRAIYVGCNTDHMSYNSADLLCTIGDKQCRGTLFVPYSIEEANFISVKLYELL